MTPAEMENARLTRLVGALHRALAAETESEERSAKERDEARAALANMTQLRDQCVECISRRDAALAKAEEENERLQGVDGAREDAFRDMVKYRGALGRAVAALHDARDEISRMATTGTGFSCTVVDDVDAVLADPTCAAAGEAWRELTAAIDQVLATEGDGTKAGREMHEVTAFYCALRDLRTTWTKVDARRGAK